MFFFSMENYNVHKRRLKQLHFNGKKEDADMSEIIDKVTKPVIRHILPHLRPANLEKIAIKLKMAKWDKKFTPMQYRALNLTLKALGIILALLLYNASTLMALVWFVALVFGMDFLLKNSVKNRKEKLISDFPDFIRITEGYLSANVPFSKAVEESIKYVGEEWRPILQNFVVESDVNSVEEALDTLKKEVDLFEVREFVALVKLTLEQGGDARESFSAQADKIREMQLDMIAIKIGKRQMMGIAIQGPLLLCNLLVFGLPTVSSMTSLSSMG
ncbi:hypothetical protein PP175_27330 (plasmid) [Aneurinibacillus sp. Ricciae_BoGa-3]|uniref:type II secretion system F family protein n=1 Tax=Aneurinibacillus sp. Ricciae_BoGa-3 TaxID=3022697 RepID=UPI002341CF47|nr:hypothetical protein [Aneurinibacillus sp. Ricciae_BoGa-3]WCK56928.1 hypothetical protein PP175_27445 [Aneurinibacillus sp. Ricciae_BoGa-3]WCK57751.1 hypothetical protein PP175_27330 [Aneurinibacillus sp. Ricciae_BoGa-3]